MMRVLKKVSKDDRLTAYRSPIPTKNGLWVVRPPSASLYTAAAAAILTASPSWSGQAFILQPGPTSTPFGTRSWYGPTFGCRHPPATTTRTRNFAIKRRNEPEEEEGFLAKVGGAVKSLLPSSWFQSEAEKKAALERKRVRDEFSGGLREMLKGAPLPVRMLGEMITPLASSVMSGLAETMAAQEATVESLLQEAQSYLVADETVMRVLGEPLQVGRPFSQSSSTSTINGQTSSRVELAFPVEGRLGSGLARLTATGAGGIQSLQVQAGGRVMAVSLSKKSLGGRSSSTFGGSKKNDDIIEAEIIEKETKK